MSRPAGCPVAMREKGVEAVEVQRDAMDLHVARIDTRPRPSLDPENRVLLTV